MLAIVGHATPDEGSEPVTTKLGLDRAEAAKAYLVAHSVLSARLRTATRGAEQPLNKNETEAQRALSRRVELRMCALGAPCP